MGKIIYMTAIILTSVLLVSCSGYSPVSPDASIIPSKVEGQTWGSQQWVWGNWELFIPEEHSRMDVQPVRSSDMHFNVKKLLENEPCDNCLWISKFVNNGDGTVSVDISLRHPYPESKFFTGFDVRGILYSPAHYIFDNPIKQDYPNVFYFPALETGDPQLLNPNGYTDAYDPFKYNESKPPIFQYQPGGDLGATFGKDDQEEPDSADPIWPFINYYSSDVRRHFATSAVVARTFHIALPSGAWKFGYAVDAVWAPPIKTPVTNIETDFPVQANTIYVYKIEMSISGPLVGQEPETVSARFYTHLPETLQYYDQNGINTLCLMINSQYSYDPVIVENKYVEFTWEIYNQLNQPPGQYPVSVAPDLSPESAEYFSGIEEDGFKNSQIYQILWVTVES